MKKIRQNFVNSLEKSRKIFEQVPGSRHTIPRGIDRDEIIRWKFYPGCLDVFIAEETDSACFEKKVSLEFDVRENKIERINYSQITMYDSEKPEKPNRQFEGDVNELGIIKLGLAALALRGAARSVSEIRQASQNPGTLDD